jgi:hypothetical protein
MLGQAMRFNIHSPGTFLKAAKRYMDHLLGGGDKIVDAATKQKRMSLCEGCEYRVGVQCFKCDYCLIRAKTLLPSEFCPVGKW